MHVLEGTSVVVSQSELILSFDEVGVVHPRMPHIMTHSSHDKGEDLQVAENQTQMGNIQYAIDCVRHVKTVLVVMVCVVKVFARQLG